MAIVFQTNSLQLKERSSPKGYLRYVVLGLFLFILTACASSFDTLDPNAEFGPQPDNYEEKIKEHFQGILRDPQSAVYQFGEPQKGYANNGWALGGEVAWHGWLVDVEINAKNGFGGYTGFKPYVVYFKNDGVYKVDQDPLLLTRL